MMTRFRPYYLSRALLSIAMALVVFGFTWTAGLMAAVVFGLFLLYLHSGWFVVDPGRPLFPLRRDERARQAQRKSLIAAIAIVAATALLSAAGAFGAIPGGPIAPLAIPLGIVVYFVTQFIMLARS
jgi:hypothetical protein